MDTWFVAANDGTAAEKAVVWLYDGFRRRWIQSVNEQQVLAILGTRSASDGHPVPMPMAVLTAVPPVGPVPPGWAPASDAPAPVARDHYDTLMVSPHPDDEVAAWDMATGTVAFVYLTRGEATGFCAQNGYDRPTCRRRRTDSTVSFIADRLGGPAQRTPDVDGYEQWVGPTWVAAFGDTGDGNVTVDEARGVIAWATARWRPNAIVSTGYEGPDYGHRDHAAARAAMPSGAFDREGFADADIVRDTPDYDALVASVRSHYGWLGVDLYLSLPAWGQRHTYRRVP
jgi:LmbE family N-acetylglucosaminyl deacetylase